MFKTYCIKRLIKNEMKLLFIEGKKNKSKTDKRSSRHVCARHLLDAIIPLTLILQITSVF